MSVRSIKFWINILAILAVFSSSASFAAKKKKSKPAPVPKQTSIVVNMDTGGVEHFDNAHKKIYPASLTKLMTLYVTFDSLKKGKLKMSQKLKTSKAAAKMKPCKLGLGVGQKIKVQDAIDALVVRSANDAAVVLAEGVAGDEKRFASLMTRTARKLGMSSTTFRNASGWHHKEQKTTAIDMAKLAIALKRDFPQYYPLFSKTKFIFNGHTIHSHNKVTKKYAGAEGMKTGYTSNAGYNLVTTASRDGQSLVAVVTGGQTGASRDKKVMSLLDKGFDVANDNVTRLASKSSKAKKQLAQATPKIKPKKLKKKTLAKAKAKPSKKTLAKASRKVTKTAKGKSRKSLASNASKKKSVATKKRVPSKSSKTLVSNKSRAGAPARVASNNYDPFVRLGT